MNEHEFLFVFKRVSAGRVRFLHSSESSTFLFKLFPPTWKTAHFRTIPRLNNASDEPFLEKFKNYLKNSQKPILKRNLKKNFPPLPYSSILILITERNTRKYLQSNDIQNDIRSIKQIQTRGMEPIFAKWENK